MDPWQREIDERNKSGAAGGNWNNSPKFSGPCGCGSHNYNTATDFGGNGNWGHGSGSYDRARGNYSDCPKLPDLTPAGYRAFETVVDRSSITTAHPAEHKAFEVIKALPTDIAALFWNSC